MKKSSASVSAARADTTAHSHACLRHCQHHSRKAPTHDARTSTEHMRTSSHEGSALTACWSHLVKSMKAASCHAFSWRCSGVGHDTRHAGAKTGHASIACLLALAEVVDVEDLGQVVAGRLPPRRASPSLRGHSRPCSDPAHALQRRRPLSTPAHAPASARQAGHAAMRTWHRAQCSPASGNMTLQSLVRTLRCAADAQHDVDGGCRPWPSRSRLQARTPCCAFECACPHNALQRSAPLHALQGSVS